MNQEEKNEQLSLTEKRLKLQKIHIGRNIIDSFQKTDPKEEEEEIELILEEANAYGLRQEVKETAEEFLKDNVFSKLSAYVIAYNKWIG